MTIRLIKRLAVQNGLGEGVIWDSVRQCIWWTDIQKSRLYQYFPQLDDLHEITAPERIACLAIVEDSDYLIVAFASGFAYFHPQSHEVKWIEKIEAENPGTRLNDGRTDRQGRFWAGTMVEDADTATAAGNLYCLDQELNLSKHISDLQITNSLCWSPNAETMYHCDTPTRTIQRYAFNSDQGNVSNRQEWVQTEEGCFPDGSTVDAEGAIWNAQWGGSKVQRYLSDGSADVALQLPVSQATCVAFGGAQLDTLFVTTARQGLSAKDIEQQPYAGDLFIFETSFKGIADTPFQPKPSFRPENLRNL